MDPSRNRWWDGIQWTDDTTPANGAPLDDTVQESRSQEHWSPGGGTDPWGGSSDPRSQDAATDPQREPRRPSRKIIAIAAAVLVSLGLGMYSNAQKAAPIIDSSPTAVIPVPGTEGIDTSDPLADPAATVDSTEESNLEDAAGVEIGEPGTDADYGSSEDGVDMNSNLVQFAGSTWIGTRLTIGWAEPYTGRPDAYTITVTWKGGSKTVKTASEGVIVKGVRKTGCRIVITAVKGSERASAPSFPCGKFDGLG